ncbi:MAG TPA: guanylate kinase [Lacunisphaera sp.]|jgi:guanylate kinase|nr:guanylate kinase [Lacunisphaera sp.]
MAAPTPATRVLLILAGPAGVGKSTLCDRLVREVPGFERVITATTRPPRPNEENGRDYHFLSEAEFDARLAAGEFLEWAWVHRKYRYGTPRSSVLDRLPHASLVMNLDVQGVRSIRAAAEQIPALKARLVTVFVAPDSLDVLRERLQGRGPVTPEELERRLQSAVLEIGERNSYDFVIHSGTKEQDYRALLDFWDQAQRRLSAAG